MLNAYDGASSDEEESEDEVDDILPFSAGRVVEPRPPTEKQKRIRVALKSVLEALMDADEDMDEELKNRLRKKEYKAARAEEKRQAAASAAPGKKADDGKRPMEVDLQPHEILRILPHLSKEEKKQLYKALRADQEAVAASYLPADEDTEKLVRQDKRTGGYSAKTRSKQKPSEGASSSSAAAAAAPPTTEDKIPEVIRKKRLKQFRQQLYENSLDKRGRVRPSEASDIPNHTQEECPHEMKDLRWGANASAHWASCGKCGLKKCLYYSMEHGALVAEQPVWLIRGGAMMVILDTGCRTSVAGALWHKAYQSQLREKQLPFHEVSHMKIFRFGAGEPVVSRRAFVYPVELGASGQLSWLRLAEVCNTESDNRVEQCPALIGPSELARWKVELNFETGMTVIAGHAVPTEMSETRHPILRVLPNVSSRAWETHELRQLKDILIKDPYSMALIQQALDGDSDSASSTPAAPVVAVEDFPEEVEGLAMWQTRLEDEAIACLDVIPQGAFTTAAAPPQETEEPSDGSFSEAESETSHDSGPEEQSSATESSDEERDYAEVLTTDVPGDSEVLNKGQRRRLLDAVQKISDAAETEVEDRKKTKVKLTRTPGPWRLIEIFTWTCMLTTLACQEGWSTYEPITLDSGWNLEYKADREKAFAYLEEIDPDVIMIAWPCGPWSVMQNANMRTDLQRRALYQRRSKARRTLLTFVKKVTLWQRRRGRIVLGEKIHSCQKRGAHLKSRKPSMAQNRWTSTSACLV